MGRNVLAIFLGAIVAVFIVASVEFAGMQLVPLPEGVDVTSPEAMRASMHLLPTAASAMALLSLLPTHTPVTIAPSSTVGSASAAK